jgi:ABC-type amino acid transport substrate-binding protein
MRTFGRRLLFALTTLFFVFGVSSSFAAPPLKIYTKPVEPFSYEEGGKPVGFSIDLWDRLAKEAGIQYEIHWVKTVNELIDALKNKEADGAVAAISITAEREKDVDFSTPFYESGLGILVGATQQSSVWAVVKGFFTADFLKLCSLLVVLLVVTAHLIWFFERKRNPDQFPAPYFAGIWESAWWAISTILSGGCDNKGPIVFGGRIVGAFWMLTSIILVAYFTASATTIMTVNQLTGDINGPSDLPGKVVGTVKGSTAEKYLSEHRVHVKEYTTIDDAYEALDKKDVKAIVYDAPILLFHTNKEHGGHKVVGRIFQKQSYGVALQPGSPYRKPINEALLKLREAGNIDELQTKWFGPPE